MKDPRHPNGSSEIDLGRRLDASLRRQFAPSETDHESIAGMVADAVDSNVDLPMSMGCAPKATGSGWWRSAAFAAAAVLLISVWFLVLPAQRTSPAKNEPLAAASCTNDAELLGRWVDAYHQAVGAGFKLPSCCDVEDCNLSAHCRTAFQTAVDVAEAAALDLCGSSCDESAGGAVSLLARYDGQPICLFVLPRRDAPELPATFDRGLHMFREDFGPLAVFEVSKDPVARVLPLVFVP